MDIIVIIKKNIMEYSDLIGEDLIEQIIANIAEDLDELEDE